MRRERDIFHARERVVGFQRLGVKNIEAGMADAARAQRLDEGCLIDQTGARGIDENHPRLHRCELRGSEKTAGLVVEREIHRDRVRSLQ